MSAVGAQPAMLHTLLALITVLPATAPRCQTPAPAAAPAPALDAAKLASEIDPLIHWLRARQDVPSGSYGGVAASALALRAMLESPRKYVPGDGPFIDRGLAYLLGRQRPDGAIAEPGASESEAADQSAMAAAALAALPPGTASEALGRAAAFAARRVPTGPAGPTVWTRESEPASAEAARARAAEILVRRLPEGRFDGPRGAVVETASAVCELDACWRVLRKQAPAAAAAGAHPLPGFEPADREKALQALQRGAAFLLTRASKGTFGRGSRPDPGITSMALGGLLALPAPRSAEVELALRQGLDWIVQQYQSGELRRTGLANYVSSAMVMALCAAGRAEDAPVIADARAFLQVLQADEGEGYGPGDKYYGGIGYGNDQRPDLSNLNMALEALSSAGVERGDPSFAKALVFLQRCQNRSESNDIEIRDGGGTIVSGNDGGASYAPGESNAGYIDLGQGKKVARSYGSMSYSLLRCYLFAGIPKEDPRVRAVWKWLMENYTLDVNPGFDASGDALASYQGLFYYFLTMARALALYGEEQVTTPDGARHAWRTELAGRLCAMQQSDGSWVNENSARWWEADPVLATGYAMAALGTCLAAP